MRGIVNVVHYVWDDDGTNSPTHWHMTTQWLHADFERIRAARGSSSAQSTCRVRGKVQTAGNALKI
jgi:hypothetical protein